MAAGLLLRAPLLARLLLLLLLGLVVVVVVLLLLLGLGLRPSLAPAR